MEMDILSQKVDAFLKENRNAIIEHIKRLVDVESVSAPNAGPHPFGEGCAKVLDIALGIGHDLGFDTENYEYCCGSIRCGGQDKEIGFFTHLDVVPASGKWEHAPFSAEQADGYLFGRGTLDDKGPAIIALYTMKCLRDLGIMEHHALRLVMGCNEENGMNDLITYKEHISALPEFSIIADGQFPVCYAEKGCLGFTIKHPLSSRCVQDIAGGEVPNVVPAMAKATLKNIPSAQALQALAPFPVTATVTEDGTIEVEATGIASHAAKPEGSRNAISVLLNALGKSGIASEDSSVFLHAAGYLNDYYGESIDVKITDQHTGRLTHVACMCWITENWELALNFNVRYPACITHTQIIESVTALVAQNGFSVDEVVDSAPIYISPTSPIVQAMTEIYNEIAQDEATPYYEGSITYARIIPNSFTYGPHFPAASAKASNQQGKEHMPDECIYIDDVLSAIKIYVFAVQRIDHILPLANQ
ncbi:MAG: Sapep family Mn(2+)-dependent dipeptidase [Christensenellaceae bacterium]|jgi:succinyl-diaminopimelate desuccinylase|nr:Sapep family Mn(2+)-dependent dipeptidase [Christensenellaceae bacterium]